MSLFIMQHIVQVLESSAAVVLRFASAEDKSLWQSHLTQAAYSASVSYKWCRIKQDIHLAPDPGSQMPMRVFFCKKYSGSWLYKQRRRPQQVCRRIPPCVPLGSVSLCMFLGSSQPSTHSRSEDMLGDGSPRLSWCYHIVFSPSPSVSPRLLPAWHSLVLQRTRRWRVVAGEWPEGQQQGVVVVLEVVHHHMRTTRGHCCTWLGHWSSCRYLCPRL